MLEKRLIFKIHTYIALNKSSTSTFYEMAQCLFPLQHHSYTFCDVLGRLVYVNHKIKYINVEESSRVHEFSLLSYLAVVLDTK